MNKTYRTLSSAYFYIFTCGWRLRNILFLRGWYKQSHFCYWQGVILPSCHVHLFVRKA